jgi:hypothetical protein
MGFFVVGPGPLGRMIGVRVIEADDVFSTLPAFTLDADQFARVDVIAIVGGIDACVAATGGTGYASTAIFIETAEKDSAALVGIGFFSMGSDLFVVFVGEYQHRSKYPIQRKT